MNRRMLAWLLLLAGCPAPSSYPLQICETWEDPCTGNFDCIGFRCVGHCTYEGDCDPGFRCVDNQCLESCDDDGECTIGDCGAIGDGRPGAACYLTNLPQCATDDHCGYGVCIDDVCVARCEWVGQCGLGLVCDFRRGDYGVCEPDPNYTPPPPPTTCHEAPSPNQWCIEQTGEPNAYCHPEGCVVQWVAVLVLDESIDALCTSDDEAPGTDLLGARFVGPQLTAISTTELGTGDGNTHTSYLAVETSAVPQCGDDWLSLGCGGGMLFLPGDGPIQPDWTFEVYTRNAWCGDQEPTAASVHLCYQYPGNLWQASQVCIRRLGPVDQITFPLGQ